MLAKERLTNLNLYDDDRPKKTNRTHSRCIAGADQPVKDANEPIEDEPFGRIDDDCIERMMKALITNRELD